MPAVSHTLRAFGVVAFSDLPDSARRVARDRGDRDRGVTLTEQPHDLPPAPLVGVASSAIAPLEFDDAQMRLKTQMSSHAAILHPPTSILYGDYIDRLLMQRYNNAVQESSTCARY
jgi:hypothetical protein